MRGEVMTMRLNLQIAIVPDLSMSSFFNVEATAKLSAFGLISTTTAPSGLKPRSSPMASYDFSRHSRAGSTSTRSLAGSKRREKWALFTVE